MRHPILLTLIPMSLVLAACPAVSNPPPLEDATQLGYVSLSEDSSGDGSIRNAVASFERVEEQNISTGEGCVVITDEKEPTITVPDSLDAGAEVTIFAGGQPYAVLDKVAADTGGVFYATNSDTLFGILPPIPDLRLSVTVPGASFPQFEDVTMPPLPPAFVVSNLSEAEPLTVESRLTWTPSTPVPSDAHSLVGFTAFLYGDNAFAYLQCTVADDGDFTFTGEVRAILSDKNFSDGYFTGFVRSFERAEVKRMDGLTARLLVSTSTVTD